MKDKIIQIQHIDLSLDENGGTDFVYTLGLSERGKLYRIKQFSLLKGKSKWELLADSPERNAI